MDKIMAILEREKEGMDKASIDSITNLDIELVNKYLGILKEHDLIENRNNKYMTTERGRFFLKKARELEMELEN